MKRFLNLFLLIACLAIISLPSCNNEPETNPQKDAKVLVKGDPSMNFPAAGVEVKAVRNEKNEVTGYFYSDKPNDIYPIEKSKFFEMDSRAANITSMVGDMDNFGYGGVGNPPCVFYDLSEPVDDLGFMDRELTSSDDNVDEWTHDFTSNSNYGCGYEATKVTVEVREKFSDFTGSTINIDGNVLYFTPNGFTRCGNAIVQTFVFTGAAASFANDGAIDIVFSENGDHIALDWSRVTVEGSSDEDGDGVNNCDDNCPGSNTDATVNIDGCNSGVANAQISGGCNMMDLIQDCADNAANHGDFVSCVSALTNAWKAAGKITGAQKGAIVSCAAQADIP